MKKAIDFKRTSYYLLSSIIVFSLSYVFAVVMGVDYNFIILFLLTLIISVVASTILFFPMILYIAMVLIFLILTIIQVRIFEIYPYLIDRIVYLFSNIYNHLLGREYMFSDNIMPTWVLFTMALSIFTSLMILKLKRKYIILPVYILFFSYYWYVFIDISIYMLSLFLFMYLILVSLDNFSKIKEQIKENKSLSIKEFYKPWRNSAIIYSIIIIIFASILPSYNMLIRVQPLESLIYKVFPYTEQMRGFGYRNLEEADNFSLGFTDFQDRSGSLGGPVELNDDLVMLVESDSEIYLRGNVLNKYENNMWTSDGLDFKEYDLNEKIYNYNIEYGDKKEINIINKNFDTFTIFHPYRLLGVKRDKGRIFNLSYDEMAIIPYGVLKGEEYSIIYKDKHSFEELIKTDINKSIINRNLYTNYPDSITDRTIELTNEITDGVESDYLKAYEIEKFLRNNFRYSLNTSTIPEGEDFIDYFLFTEKKGYCTYFASTMAIMLRIEGIPSRYVEGYIVNNQVEEGFYEVRQDTAHAWVEAFIEPVGWVKFEPTPNYTTNTIYVEIEESDEEQMSESTIDSSYDMYELELENPFIEDREDSNIEDVEEDNEEGFNINLISLIRYFIFIVLFAFIPIKIIVAILMRKYRLKKAKNRGKDIYAIELYSDIIKSLSYLNLYNEGLTPKEFGAKVNIELYNQYYNFNNVTEIFMLAKYSNHKLSDEDLQKIEEYFNYVESLCINKMGRLKYLNKKYINLI